LSSASAAEPFDNKAAYPRFAAMNCSACADKGKTKMLTNEEIQKAIDTLETLKMYVPDSEIPKIDETIKLLMDLPEFPN